MRFCVVIQFPHNRISFRSGALCCDFGCVALLLPNFKFIASYLDRNSNGDAAHIGSNSRYGQHHVLLSYPLSHMRNRVVAIRDASDIGFIEGAYAVDHVFYILDTRCFVAGVHCQLGKSYVQRVYRHM